VPSVAYFQYGHSSAYGQETAPVSIGASESSVAPSTTLMGL
jgi:hypothetical protein